MTPQEVLYIDSLSTQLKSKSFVNPKVFFAPSFSQTFINTLAENLNFNVDHVFDNGLTIPKASNYDIIICTDKEISTIKDFGAYSKYLNINGVVSTFCNNKHFLQSTTRNTAISGLRLNNLLDAELSTHQLVPIFREPVGKFTKLHKLPSSHTLSKFISKFGNKLPNSILYSPYLCLIYQKSIVEKTPPYVSATSLSSRFKRVYTRVIYKIENHKINDYIIVIHRHLNRLLRFIKVVLYIQHYDFIKQILPLIPRGKPTTKKVLVIAMTYLQIGGVERVMLNILKGIDRNKFEIHLLTTSFSHNPWHDTFNRHVDRIVHVPDVLDEHWTDHYRTKYIAEYISINKANILLITNASTAYHALPKIKKALPSLRVYDLLHTHGTPRDKDAYLKISIPFDKYIDKRIVIDEYLKSYYIRKYPVEPNKIAVIYNGIDLHHNKTKDDEDNQIYRYVNLDRKVITFIGRLESDKSPMRLVDIAIELKKRNLPISILVVGDGTLMPSMIKMAEESDTINREIFFHGNSDHPLPLAEKSYFTLLVSNAEGIPMSILESMSVRTPAIASAVGGIPEIIENEKDGILVEISSLKDERMRTLAFVDSITKACSLTLDEYEKMQTQAQKKISARFSHMPMIYEHLFETGEVLNEHDITDEVYS